MKAKAKSQNTFMRIVTIPIRGLIKARDMYVRGMTSMERMSCAKVPVGGGSGGRWAGNLPKSYSVASSRTNDNDDFAELVRAASARDYGGRFDLDVLLKQQLREELEKTTTTTTGAKGLPKCSSVGMGKIDEEKPCEFSDDDGKTGYNKKADFLNLRSKSYAVSKGSAVVF